MYQKKMDEDIRCPLEYGLSILCGKWKSRIICLLGFTKPMRYHEIKENLPDISDSVLSATLTELIHLDIINKHNETENHTLTEYTLTEKAISLLPLLTELCRWSAPYYSSKPETVMPHCRDCELLQCKETAPSEKQP